MVLLVLVSGLMAGFLSGLLGLGGGILLAPILLYAPQLVGLDSLPVKEITGLTMTQGLAGAISGVARHHFKRLRVVASGRVHGRQHSGVRSDWRAGVIQRD